MCVCEREERGRERIAVICLEEELRSFQSAFPHFLYRVDQNMSGLDYRRMLTIRYRVGVSVGCINSYAIANALPTPCFEERCRNKILSVFAGVGVGVCVGWGYGLVNWPILG